MPSEKSRRHPSPSELARALIDRYGTTYAEEAGIRLRDTPAPLYQLLVLAVLLSARIRADVAVAAARELFRAGLRTPQAMLRATWQARVDALGRGHYRRYDERTATMLGDGARLVLERWRGDLRRLRAEAPDVDGVRKLLQEVPGIGPTGSAIFCREVQGVWPELAPFVDNLAARGADRLGLPSAPRALAGYAEQGEFVRLVAGCVRSGLSAAVARDLG